jgi:amino acid transporter
LSEETPSENTDVWVNILIIGRVILMLVIWIALFLAIFMGYFTSPLILIAVITVIYAISDLGIFVALRKQKPAQSERAEYLEMYTERTEIDKREK